MSDRRAVLLAGIPTIAVAYGLARYAYGLFVPELAAALELGDAAVGLAGGAGHLGYAVGLVSAPRWVRWRGSAAASVDAGVLAAAGLAGVAVAVDLWSLTLAVAIGGAGSGLASPALARAVADRLVPAVRSAAQTWVNSGTSVGLAVSAPTVLLAVSWRVTWGAFAAVALATALVARRLLRPGTDAPTPPETSSDPVAPRLLAHGAVLGATSAAFWTFSAQRVVDAGLAPGWASAFWVTIGLVGLAGGSAGALADRVGLRVALRRWSALWVAAIAVLALPTLPAPVALLSAAGFGAAFMALTGLIIVWATGVHDDAAAGVRACFLALGLGQAVGTPLAGAGMDLLGASATFLLSAAGGLALLALTPPRARRPSSASRP